MIKLTGWVTLIIEVGIFIAIIVPTQQQLFGELGQVDVPQEAVDEANSITNCRPTFVENRKIAFYAAFGECKRSLDAMKVDKLVKGNSTTACLFLCSFKKLKFVEKKTPKNATLENIAEEIYPGSNDASLASQAAFRDDFNVCYNDQKPTGTYADGCYGNKGFIQCFKKKNKEQCKATGQVTGKPLPKDDYDE